ncbi:MAG: NAD-dependent deacylase [Chitinophagia bacterium]|nr:NAD-dependent deacylase [Chitinophagia bacterium]
MGKKRLVVLSGAGISAQSGIKTFRDSDGLWEGHAIEDVATPRAWKKNPALVLEFYNMRRKNALNAMPNAAHTGLAALEAHFDVHIVTQNVDDLHERAGSTKVLHLHGELLKMRSERNEHLVFDIREDMNLGDLAPDGAQLRPHIVWFEEPVPMIEQAIPIVQSADIFVVIGTSLVVYPAAGLVDYVRHGVTTYVIDKRIPPMQYYSNAVPMQMSATEGVAQLTDLLLKG